ncbi:MAG: hypothetical protein KBD78_06405 [Oligoflexales bacterium]|nr:hypothetical protein [Oligoflexales bacterium]
MSDYNREEKSSPQNADQQNIKKIFLDFLIPILIPSMILQKASPHIGAIPSLTIALSIPLLYGAYDFWKTRKHNIFAVLGFASHLLTGAVIIFEFGALGIAVKEAAVPLAIGIFVLLTQQRGSPLIRTMLYNPAIFDVQKIQKHLEEKSNVSAFENLMKNANLLLAASFVLSATLNFILAIVVIQHDANTVEFTQEYGRMMLLSWPVIVVPSMIIMFVALWYLVKGISRLTGLNFESILLNKGQTPSQ